MKKPVLIGIAAAVGLVLLIISSGLFTVHESRQALVLQFGEAKRVVKEPGLNWKLPVVQQIEYFDERVLAYGTEEIELILGDQKRLIVDAFTRYRIEDPLRFRQSVGSIPQFNARLQSIVEANLRNVLGEVSLVTVLSDQRQRLMSDIRDLSNTALVQFGVDVIDMRIRRADLPSENSEAIFSRMRTEREREAKELRAQGDELAQRITARADRERRVLIAEAERESQIIRGTGEADAARIFAQAFGKNEDFYEFFRSMQAYRGALSNGSTSFVMSPDSEFLRYLRSTGSSDEVSASSLPSLPESQSAPVDDSDVSVGDTLIDTDSTSEASEDFTAPDVQDSTLIPDTGAIQEEADAAADVVVEQTIEEALDPPADTSDVDNLVEEIIESVPDVDEDAVLEGGATDDTTNNRFNQ